MSKISVIIPIKTSTNKDALAQCIKSVAAALDKTPFEVIIIDNLAIADPTMQQTLNQWYNAKLVDVIKWRFQFNAAAMLNYGATFATGDYLLFVEPDIIVPENTFNSINSSILFVNDKSFGIIGTGIRNMNNNEMVFGYDFDYKGEISAIHSCPIGVKQVLAVRSIFMLVSAKIFDRMNGFNEEYHENYYDIDFCLRVKGCGLNTIVCSDIIIDKINDNPFPFKRSFQISDYKLFMKNYSGLLPENKDKKLLVVKLMTLGDCICSIPALKKLRLKYINHEITLIANERYADVFMHHKFYDKLILVKDIDRNVFNSHLPEYHYYDMVTCEAINSNDYDKIIELNTLCYMGEYKRSGRTLAGHYADLAEVDLTLEEERPEIRYTKSDVAVVSAFMDEKVGPITEGTLFIGLHLFAGWDLKNWGVENYKQLIENLKSTGNKYKYFVFGSPGQGLEGVDDVINIGNDLTFNQCAYLMKRLDCYVGPDSGFLHMASAMNCPTVGLFGCGNPVVGMSYSDYSIQLLPTNGCQTPCLTTICPKYQGGCTQYISNDTVSKAVSLLIDANKNNKEKIKIVVIGSNMVIANFVNWEWHFSMGAPL